MEENDVMEEENGYNLFELFLINSLFIFCGFAVGYLLGGYHNNDDFKFEKECFQFFKENDVVLPSCKDVIK